jgi:hypothetical protein
MVSAAILPASRRMPIGGCEAAAEAAGRIADAYDAVAALIGAQRDEIAFVESATPRLVHGVLRGAVPGGLVDQCARIVRQQAQRAGAPRDAAQDGIIDIAHQWSE